MRALVIISTLLSPLVVAACNDGSGEIQGELCDMQGRPIAGAPVYFDGVDGTTDANGYFRATGVSPGIVSVVIGESHRAVDVNVRAHDIAVVFDDACRVANRDAPPFVAFGEDVPDSARVAAKPMVDPMRKDLVQRAPAEKQRALGDAERPHKKKRMKA